MDDQPFYNIVALELRDRALKPGLWARAVAEAGHEGGAARALYIRLRVSELMQERESLRLLAKFEKDQQRERDILQLQAKRDQAKAWAKIAFAVITVLTLVAVILKLVLD
jgi:hypothetical protein